MQCKNLEKHQKIKSNSSWWQERLKIRAWNNKMETKKQMKIINDSKNWVLEKPNYLQIFGWTKKKERDGQIHQQWKEPLKQTLNKFRIL